MKIENKNNYTLIVPDEENFEDFFVNFKTEHSLLKSKNLIIKLLEKFSVKNKNILLFLEQAEIHLENSTSFILICDEVNVDEFPDFLNIVPTLQEAEDVLEIENIQRDLGF